MPRSLGQVIGVEKHLRQQDNEVGRELKKRVQSEAHTTGRIKTFTADREDAPPEHIASGERKEVALTVHDALAEAAKAAIPAIDITATKDKANQTAAADVIVGEVTLLRDVPVSHLLWLEHYLSDWKGFITVLPVLEPSRRWTEDDGRKGLWKSDPEVTGRYVKDVTPLILHPGTEKHPPQVQALQRDVHVGTFSTTILSGAVTADRKKELLAHCDELLRATKDAIARANMTPVTEVSAGKAVMDFLIG